MENTEGASPFPSPAPPDTVVFWASRSHMGLIQVE